MSETQLPGNTAAITAPRLRARGLRPACVGAAFLVSAADLIYWWASSSAKSLGPVLPMPPVAAIAFLLLSTAFASVLVFRDSAWPKRWLMPLSGLATGATLIRAVPGFGDWESVFDPAHLIFLGMPAGQSRYQIAILIAATGFTLCTKLRAPRGSRWWKVAVVCAGSCALLGFLTLVADTAGNPMFSGAGLLGVPPPAAVVFLLLNAALVLTGDVARQLRAWLLGSDAVETAPASLREDRLALQFFGMLGCVAVLGVTYLRVQTGEQREKMAEALKTDAGLKAAQIVKWRQDREGDAMTSWGAPWSRETMTTLVTKGLNPEQHAELEGVMANFIRVYRYRRYTIFDREMRPIYGHPDQPDLTPALLQAALKTGFTGPLLETPPYADRSGTLLWGHLIRIRRRYSEETGAYALVEKELRELFPYLQAWPKDNTTGQTVLWLRRDKQIFALGGVRDAPDVSAAFREPFAVVRNIDDGSSTIVRVARGESEPFEGPDPRGVPLLVVGRLIPNSDWMITSTMRTWEIYAPLRRTSWMVVGFSSVILGMVGFVMTGFWRNRHQHLVSVRLLADLEQKRATARLGTVMRHARDTMIIVDANLDIVEVNPCAAEMYGWTTAELCRMNARHLRTTESRQALGDAAAKVRDPAGGSYEAEHQRKDGTRFPVEVSTRAVELDGRPHYFSIVRDISERKRAEAQLRVSEERHRLIGENTSDVIWLVDLRTSTYTYVSPSIKSTTGWLPEEVIGRQLGGFSTAAGDMRLKTQEQVAAFNAGDPLGRVRLHKLELLHKDGSTHHAEVLATILPSADGRAETLLGVSRDVSERTRAEAALRASEERYRLIAENTSDVIWLYDISSNGFTYVSAAAFPLLGFEPDELLGQGLAATLTEGSDVKARNLFRQLFDDVQVAGKARHVVVELEQRHKDGRIVPTEVTASLLPGPVGRPQHVLGITRDITERRRAQAVLEKFNADLEKQVELRTAELAARNREIEALVESIPDTVLLCNGHGELISSHSPLDRDADFPFARAAAGQSLPHDHPVVREIAREMHTIAWAGQQVVVLEFDRTINGSTCSIEARAAPAGDDRLLILLRDISARKRLERGVLANLEREKQLSEMKSQFVSVASHEFRTPLAAAVGSLELLERHAARLTEAKRTELIGRIQRSLGRLTAIMNDVLQLSRADSGRIKVKRMDIDLPRFVRDIIQEVQAGDTGKHVFTFEQTGGPDVVPVDTSLVNHILSNLLGNAVRYSPPATQVTLRLAIAADAFSLMVADEGIGIPEADRERIFEPFARGSNVGQIGGTGLGLNIVKRYAELMGGRIELVPTPRGAAFLVSIPFNPPAQLK